METPQLSDEAWTALGRMPSGLFILTAREAGDSGRETGMLASWAQQASFDPPQVTIAVNKSRYLCDWIDAGAALTLNILGDGDKSMLAHFGKGFEPDEAAFEGLSVERNENGAAMLVGCAANLELRARDSIDAGDHRILLAEVIGGTVRGDAAPLTHVRKSGQRY